MGLEPKPHQTTNPADNRALLLKTDQKTKLTSQPKLV